MEGKFERRIINLEERSDTKALVMRAAKEAVTEVALKYEMSPENAGAADRAIEDMIINYESTSDHEKIPDLKNMAYDAAEDIFRTLGYTQPEIMRDFLSRMNKGLGHADAA